jgi:hypothetical protein
MTYLIYCAILSALAVLGYFVYNVYLFLKTVRE